MHDGPRPIPVAWEALDRQIAAGIRREMDRRGLSYADMRRMLGISERRVKQLSQWIRQPSPEYSIRGGLAIAERLGIPISVQVSDLEPVVVLNDRGQRRRVLDAELAA